MTLGKRLKKMDSDSDSDIPDSLKKGDPDSDKFTWDHEKYPPSVCASFVLSYAKEVKIAKDKLKDLFLNPGITAGNKEEHYYTDRQRYVINKKTLRILEDLTEEMNLPSTYHAFLALTGFYASVKHSQCYRHRSQYYHPSLKGEFEELEGMIPYEASTVVQSYEKIWDPKTKSYGPGERIVKRAGEKQSEESSCFCLGPRLHKPIVKIDYHPETGEFRSQKLVLPYERKSTAAEPLFPGYLRCFQGKNTTTCSADEDDYLAFAGIGFHHEHSKVRRNAILTPPDPAAGGCDSICSTWRVVRLSEKEIEKRMENSIMTTKEARKLIGRADQLIRFHKNPVPSNFINWGLGKELDKFFERTLIPSIPSFPPDSRKERKKNSS